MKTKSMTTLPALALGVALLAAPAALAEQFRVLPDESGTVCQSGSKSDAITIEGEENAAETAKSAVEQLYDMALAGKPLSSDDVVRAVCYLLEADYVTGEVLVVDGGRNVRH